MAASSSSMAQLARTGVKPNEAGLQPNAKFKRLYGIPPKGKPPKGGWVDSDYGFPVPPAAHPDAVKYARGVLSRAHMSKNFSPVDLKRQIAKAQAILKRHDRNYNPSKSPSKMSRESIPTTPPGSWERASGMIQKAAQLSKSFGGPANDDPKLDNADTVRSWDIFIYASYPAKQTVVIANDKVGKMWETQFAVNDGAVTFSGIKPVQLSFAQESGRKARVRENARRESSVVPLRERLLFEGRLREGSIDLEKGTARIIILQEGPGNAADKHFYTESCLQEAVESKVFEGAQNYVDHPSKVEDQIIPERMVEKLGGWFSDVAMATCENSQGATVACIEATFIPEPGNELVLNKLRAAQQYANQFAGRSYIGFSINAAGVGVPAEIDGQEYHRVDRIVEVISVDLVTRAGAGGKLLQLKESDKKLEAQMSVNRKIRRAAAKAALTEALKINRAALKEAGIGLSPEQDEALDKALGIEDGGALDQMLDQVTMGAPETEAALDGAADPDETATDGPADDNADDPDADDEDLDEMNEASLKSELKAARKREKEAKNREIEAKREADKAKRESQSARLTAEGLVRENEATRILEKLNPPAAHRPRMLREMKQATKVSEMESIANEYATAFLARETGVGGTAPKAAAVKINCLAD